jgi:hypothetical protein
MEDNTDKLARAYSLLFALRQNLPTELYNIDEDYVDQYHEALDHLSQLGYDVEEFKIPEQWVKTETWQVPDGEGYETRHSKTRQVDLAKFQVKLDSVLKYFSLTTLAPSENQRPIGFTGRKK